MRACVACVCARACAFPGWRGWGFPRRAAGALCPPKCRRGPPPPPRLVLRPRGGWWGPLPARGKRREKRARDEAPGRWPPRSVPFGKRPRAASGLWAYPRGVGGRGRSRALAAGARGGGVAGPRPFRCRSPPAPGGGGVPATDARPASSAAPRAARPGSVPAPAASPRRVGAGGSGRGRVVRARPRPGDACPGGDPRDAAASPAAARFPPGCGRAALRARSRARGWASVGGWAGAHGVRRSSRRGRLAAAWRTRCAALAARERASERERERERERESEWGGVSRSVGRAWKGARGEGGRAWRSGGDRRVFSTTPPRAFHAVRRSPLLSLLSPLSSLLSPLLSPLPSPVSRPLSSVTMPPPGRSRVSVRFPAPPALRPARPSVPWPPARAPVPSPLRAFLSPPLAPAHGRG